MQLLLTPAICKRDSCTLSFTELVRALDLARLQAPVRRLALALPQVQRPLQVPVQLLAVGEQLLLQAKLGALLVQVLVRGLGQEQALGLEQVVVVHNTEHNPWHKVQH